MNGLQRDFHVETVKARKALERIASMLENPKHDFDYAVDGCARCGEDESHVSHWRTR